MSYDISLISLKYSWDIFCDKSWNISVIFLCQLVAFNFYWYICDILGIFLWYSWGIFCDKSWDISVIFLCQLVALPLIRCGPKVIEATWRRQRRIGDKKWGIIRCFCPTWLDRTPPNISSMLDSAFQWQRWNILWNECWKYNFGYILPRINSRSEQKNLPPEPRFKKNLQLKLWLKKNLPTQGLIQEESPTQGLIKTQALIKTQEALIKRQKRFLPQAMLLPLRPLCLLLILTSRP